MMLKQRRALADRDLLERRVRVAESITFAPPPGGGLYLTKLPDGSLITAGSSSEYPPHGLISFDEGRTWTKVAPPQNYVHSLRDGTILIVGLLPREALGAGVFLHDAWRGKHSYDSLHRETCRVVVPDAVAGTGDDMVPGACKGMVFQSPTITELPDGRLLAPLYGWFVEDTAPSDEPEYVAAAQRKGVAMPRRTRVIVVASEDRGLNWHYLATVCARVDPQDAAGRPIPHEGPCEPTMALAPNGELVCVMRVGRMTPLYQSRSHDEGRTWNEAEPLHTIGVAPFMRVISHGVLACSYGTKADLWQGEQQQEIRIMFSFDNGRSWELDKPVYVGAVCAYTAFCEVSPGVLLYVYAPHTWSMPGDPEWPGIKGKKSRCGRLARITLRL